MVVNSEHADTLKLGVKGLLKSNLTRVTNANHYVPGLLLYFNHVCS